MKRLSTKLVYKNVAISLTAQVISLFCGVVLQLVVPRFIDEYQYAYWQTYVLYSGYVGILHFGLLDGFVLRYSQYDYDELEEKTVRSQFHFLLLFLGFVGIGFTIASLFILNEINATIVRLVGVGIVVKNVFTYSLYIHQMTNRINKYARIVIIQRGVYALFVTMLILMRNNDYKMFCIAEQSSEIIAAMLGAYFSTKLYFGKDSFDKETIIELKQNLQAGVLLLFANWSANLLIGSSKMIIQWQWGTLTFGKTSFAFSMTSVFLSLVSAISVVLFPSIKRMKPEEMPDLYEKIREVSTIFLLAIMIAYFPGSVLLKLWLPKYTESIAYIGILLPFIVSTSKISLLTNTYLKAYRKEKTMLIINVLSIAVALIVYFTCVSIFDSLKLLLFSVVLVIMARSIVSEHFVCKLIGKSFTVHQIEELVITILFIAITQSLTLWVGCAAYALVLFIYFFRHRKSITLLAKK